MGLDIKAKSKIVTKKESPEAYEFNMLLDADSETMYVNPDFSDHITEYDAGDSSDNLVEYVKTDETVEHEFSAGSYQAYNKFRNLLCHAVIGVDAETVWDDADAGGKKYLKKPMFRLVNFSDCEGAIDSNICAGLLEDFKNNRDKFINYISEHDDIGDMDLEHYTEEYDNWTKAFEVGADEGVVIFR